MQHFTVIHDGNDQGWQAAYLAFHIAARLGAPLRALIIESHDKKADAQRAAQVEVGGRAAGVSVESRLITDFSLSRVTEHFTISNGLFIPRRLIPDEKTARRFMGALSCPLWLVSTESAESAMDGMALLIGDSASDNALSDYATILAHRIQLPITGFVHKNNLSRVTKSNPDISWHPLQSLTSGEISKALKQVDASLLFLPIFHFSLIDKLRINCVVYPASQDA